MQLQNDVFELRMDSAKYHMRQMQFIESSMATARLPASVSRGHAILVDATGREHTLLLDQCLSLDVRSHKASTWVYRNSHDGM